ncbi:MAG: hypothetical protein HC903_02970 [Methylacidiphilales bacterium]|nr:hypothetical protein [Candidatus Methylacidiphilales bacterium]NJR14543.1 hypothetical protein [Calothrix sp. CSU_2_0]
MLDAKNMWASMSLLELIGEVLAVHVNTNKIFLDVFNFALIKMITTVEKEAICGIFIRHRVTHVSFQAKPIWIDES